MDMRVNIAGVEWRNPVTVASGTFGSGEEFSEFVDLNKLGAVTTKGVANVPWPGNPTPRVAEDDMNMSDDSFGVTKKNDNHVIPVLVVILLTVVMILLIVRYIQVRNQRKRRRRHRRR